MARVAGDSLVYGEIAKTWLQHGVYGVDEAGPTPGSIEIRPTLIRLPGYPLFLAACFRLFGMENYRAVLNVQVAADLVTCCLASALAGRLFGRRARLPVLWLAALCPFTANYTSTALAETLVFTTIALAFYAFARWQDAGLGYNRWLWTVAAALAYSILLRPEQGLLAAAVLPAMLWRSLATREPRVRPLAFGPAGTGRRALRRASAAVMDGPQRTHLPRLSAALPARCQRSRRGGPARLRPLVRSWAIDFASVDEVCWPMDGERIELLQPACARLRRRHASGLGRDAPPHRRPDSPTTTPPSP